ncbi:MAG: class I SAM-dependent methyltransferase, partial [Oscillospiraceae bacterium]|nr:class I SAM-dependent methyltransferase [Oscillospiraceae bacterium]
VEMCLDFFERGENGFYTRYEDSFSEIAFDEDIIDGLLEKCGFEIVGKYDYDSFDPPREDSEKLVYAAKKLTSDKL